MLVPGVSDTTVEGIRIIIPACRGDLRQEAQYFRSLFDRLYSSL